jgi:hypothetical protein
VVPVAGPPQSLTASQAGGPLQQFPSLQQRLSLQAVGFTTVLATIDSIRAEGREFENGGGQSLQTVEFDITSIKLGQLDRRRRLSVPADAVTAFPSRKSCQRQHRRFAVAAASPSRKSFAQTDLPLQPIRSARQVRPKQPDDSSNCEKLSHADCTPDAHRRSSNASICIVANVLPGVT